MRAAFCSFQKKHAYWDIVCVFHVCGFVSSALKIPVLLSCGWLQGNFSACICLEITSGFQIAWCAKTFAFTRNAMTVWQFPEKMCKSHLKKHKLKNRVCRRDLICRSGYMRSKIQDKRTAGEATEEMVYDKLISAMKRDSLFCSARKICTFYPETLKSCSTLSVIE